jgi:uncharacterized protein YdhG (YjbR/CyaY superfamily)
MAPASGGSAISPDAQAYIDGIAARHRPLFDRLHQLIMSAQPAVTVVLSYGMPTYTAGQRRLYVGVWKHGLSMYGWPQGDDGGFAARHPELVTGKGTIRLRPQDAAGLSDDELRDLVRAALGLRG